MKIGTLGFPDDQLKKLEKILGLSKRSLVLVNFDQQQLPDLLLLFGTEQLEEQTVAELPDEYRSRLILISKKRPDHCDLPHIKFPLISSRVIRTLEQFQPLQEPAESSPEPTQEPTPEAAPESVPESAAGESDAEELPDFDPVEPDTNEPKENPFSKYESRIAEVQKQKAHTSPVAETATYSVLVVDDSHPMQQMLARELEQMEQPVSIDFADNGEEALARVADKHYDFIFLDIMMPGIDGFETCTRMRAMPPLKKTPIIMLSSKTSPLDEVKGIMAGSSTYLTKPIEHSEFQKVIRRVSRWVSEFKK